VNPREGNDPMLVPMSEADLLKDLAIARMAGGPGERFEYSNLGYGLMGYVLERASGHSYRQLLQTRIVDRYRLGSTDTELATENAGRLVTPYRKEDPIARTEPWRTGKLVAASGLYSTVEDLARLMTVQLEAYTEDGDDGLITTANSKAVGDGRDYGYGMNVQLIEVGDRSVDLHFHSGDMDGYAAFYGFVPSMNSGFVLLVSRGGSGKTELQQYALRQILGIG
jgi:CubicO group peptidase (beta-lactamase class C family)